MAVASNRHQTQQNFIILFSHWVYPYVDRCGGVRLELCSEDEVRIEVTLLHSYVAVCVDATEMAIFETYTFFLLLSSVSMPALILPLWMTHYVLKLQSLAFKIEKHGVGMGKVPKTKTFYWKIKA